MLELVQGRSSPKNLGRASPKTLGRASPKDLICKGHLTADPTLVRGDQEVFIIAPANLGVSYTMYTNKVKD